MESPNKEQLQNRILHEKSKEIVSFIDTVIGGKATFNVEVLKNLLAARNSFAKIQLETTPTKFRVYFVNHSYYAQTDFDDSESALEYGKKACFECVVCEFRGKTCLRRICSWCPIGGTKYFV